MLHEPSVQPDPAGHPTAVIVPPPSPLNAPPKLSTDLTDFYVKYCYLLLIVLLILNAVIAALLLRNQSSNPIASVLTSTVLSFGILTGLFGFLENKQKIPLRKRIVTLALATVLPFAQGIVPFLPKVPASMTTADLGLLHSAVSVINENEYKNPRAIATAALPALESLAKKYPNHEKVLLPLGVWHNSKRANFRKQRARSRR